MTQRQETLIREKPWQPNTPGAREAEGDIQQQTPTQENNTQGLGEQMHSSNEATQMCTQDTFHKPENTNSLRDTRDNTMHMVFKGEHHYIHHCITKANITIMSIPFKN